MSPSALIAAMAVLGTTAHTPANRIPIESERERVDRVVGAEVRRLMARFKIPGMAVGIAMDGKSYFSYFGLASQAQKKPVRRTTLFEIGSVSKTFTATLATYAQLNGKLSLGEPASTRLPSLRGSSFDKVSLLNLATHTSGGLPLQVPDGINDNAQLMAYFRQWVPATAPGMVRTYSNPGIGMLGMIAAMAMGQEFLPLMEEKVLPGLGMKNTYLMVPRPQIDNYAQGYTSQGQPIRMTPGVLWAEAYGIKTTAVDLLRYVETNMRLVQVDDTWQKALKLTHTGYYKIGPMTQDLVWEQYPDKVRLEDLLGGNSSKISLEPNPALELRPPMPPREDVLINKTGSTNGFAAYVAFLPKKKLGIVLLANKSYPIDARVTVAYEILKQLDGISNVN